MEEASLNEAAEICALFKLKEIKLKKDRGNEADGDYQSAEGDDEMEHQEGPKGKKRVRKKGAGAAADSSKGKDGKEKEKEKSTVTNMHLSPMADWKVDELHGILASRLKSGRPEGRF